MFQRFEWRVLFRVFLLCFTLFIAAWLVVTAKYIYIVVLSPLIIYQLVDFYKFHKKAHDELSQFVESVH